MKNFKSKIIAIALISMLSISITSCSSSKEKDTKVVSNPVSETTTIQNAKPKDETVLTKTEDNEDAIISDSEGNIVSMKAVTDANGADVTVPVLVNKENKVVTKEDGAEVTVKVIKEANGDVIVENNGTTVINKAPIKQSEPTTKKEDGATSAQNSSTSNIKLEMGSSKGKVGTTIELPIILANSDGISAANFEIIYDKDVFELEDCFTGDGFGGAWTVSQNDTGYVIYLSADGKNQSGNGTFGIASFKVKKDAKEGTYPISIGYAKYSKSMDNTQKSFDFSETIEGQIEITK